MACERCIETKKHFPEYEYCPFCGDHLVPQEVRQAVNTLSNYCSGRWKCTGCLFYGSPEVGCLFRRGEIPSKWGRRVDNE